MANGFKTGGRQKGTPNKQTAANREKMQLVFDNIMDSGLFEASIRMLPAEKLVAAMIKMSSYLVPKATTENTSEEMEPVEQTVYSLYTPVASREEVERIRKYDLDEADMAKLIHYNEKNKLKWDQEAEEAFVFNTDNALRSAKGLCQLSREEWREEQKNK